MPAADLRCDAEEVCQPLDRIEDAEESRKELAERGVEVSDVQVFPGEASSSAKTQTGTAGRCRR